MLRGSAGSNPVNPVLAVIFHVPLPLPMTHANHRGVQEKKMFKSLLAAETALSPAVLTPGLV